MMNPAAPCIHDRPTLALVGLSLRDLDTHTHTRTRSRTHKAPDSAEAQREQRDLHASLLEINGCMDTTMHILNEVCLGVCGGEGGGWLHGHGHAHLERGMVGGALPLPLPLTPSLTLPLRN